MILPSSTLICTVEYGSRKSHTVNEIKVNLIKQNLKLSSSVTLAILYPFDANTKKSNSKI